MNKGDSQKFKDSKFPACELSHTTWICLECSFTTTKESIAKIHAAVHTVKAHYDGFYKQQRPGQFNQFIKHVGMCVRCGRKFWDRDEWVLHELSIRPSPGPNHKSPVGVHIHQILPSADDQILKPYNPPGDEANEALHRNS